MTDAVRIGRCDARSPLTGGGASSRQTIIDHMVDYFASTFGLQEDALLG